MKRVKAFWNSIWKNDRRLVALCYAVFLAGSILASLYGFAEDAYQRARGNVAQTEISGAQEDVFALTDLEQEGDLYTSTSVDPRMELDLAAVSPTGVPAYVRRVTVRVTFLNMDPGELSVFYKPRADMEEYDATYRVWAHKEAEDGVYTFTLPRGALYGLRLDPGIYSGMQFRLESVIINEPRGFFEWFLPTRPWLLCLAVVPLLTASVLKYLALAAAALGARRAGGAAAARPARYFYKGKKRSI